MTKKFSAISLFSGGGGLDLGIARAGFATRVAVDYEPYACETLRMNQALGKRVSPGHAYLKGCAIIHADIRKVSSASLLEVGGFGKGEADLLVGGPPCVTFSVAGKRKGLQHEMGLLYEEYVRVLRDTKPAAFIFENVKGMLTANGKEAGPGAFETILKELKAVGYKLAWRVVDAADYGVPQHRHRVFVIGLRDGEPVFPPATHADPRNLPLLASSVLKPWRTVRDAIGDLPTPVAHDEEPVIPNHRARLHSEKTVASLAATPPGQRNASYKRDRLEWDEPAKTIRAQGKLKADGSGQKNSSHQNIHPREHRQLTVRESARIQTFPDWYLFDSSFVNGYRVVGDAVPPDLAHVLALSVRQQLESLARPQTSSGKQKRAVAGNSVASAR